MQSSRPIKKGQVEDFISNSTQNALNLKANILNPSFSGTVKLMGNPTNSLLFIGPTNNITSLPVGTNNFLTKWNTSGTLSNTIISDNGTSITINGSTLANQFVYTRATNIVAGTDLNTITNAGFYDGLNLINAPTSGWYFTTVQRYSTDANWVHQSSTSFGSFNQPNRTFSRVRSGGTWTTWVELLTTSNGIAGSGTTNKLPIFISGGTLGDSPLTLSGTSVIMPYVDGSFGNNALGFNNAGDGLMMYLSSVGQANLISSRTNGFNIGTNNSSPLLFLIDNTEKARLSTSGNFSIGLPDDGINKLQVGGSVIATSFIKSGGTSSQILLADGSVGSIGSVGGIAGSGTTNYLSKWDSISGLTNSQITDDGTFVGIGATIKTSKLSFGNIAYTGSGTANIIALYENGNVKYGFGINTGGFLDISANQAPAGGGIRFFGGSDNTSPTERMRIVNNGNVLIGTTVDGFFDKLQVNGNIRASGQLYGTNGFFNYTADGLFSVDARPSIISGVGSNRTIRFGYIDYGLGQYYPRVGFESPISTWSAGIAGTNGDDFAIGRGNLTNNDLYITSGGSIGLGTNNPLQKLHLSGNVLSTGYIKAGGLSSEYLMADGSVSTIGSSGTITGTGVAGQVSFFNSINGITGNTGFTWNNTNQRLVINGPNVGSGTTLDIYSPITTGLPDNVLRLNSASVGVAMVINATKLGGTGQSSIYFQKNGVNTWSYGSDINANGTKDFYIYDATSTITPFFITSTDEVRLGGDSVGLGGRTNNQKMTIKTNGNVLIGTTGDTGEKLQVFGNTKFSNTASTATTVLISSSTQNSLVVIGSGNSTTNPIFSVQGSQGELFSVNDNLTGSLFSVNDISGLPVIEAFSDNTILMGSFQAPSLNTTVKTLANIGSTNIYSIPTSAYTGAWIDYTVNNGLSLRAGSLMAVFSGTNIQYTETSTSDIGNTSGITFNIIISGASAIYRASGVTSGWTIKSIIRSI